MVKSKFTPQEKIRIVLESLNTNISAAELCRKYNVSPPTLYQWKERFLEGGKASLSGASNGDAPKSMKREIDNLKRIIGELTIANDAFKKTLEGDKG